jgi:putative RNA 2'-phosphotransferase
VLGALQRQFELRFEDLIEVVELNDKQRFEFTPDLSQIRARQGHSVAVELALPAQPPPAVLFHGTVERFWPAIAADGLKKMRRHHVHLSPDEETARKVGARRGRPLILRIDAAAMAAEGAAFFLSGNGVWLTEAVPARFITRSAASPG